MANELGKGYITIEPDAKNFKGKLESEIKPGLKAAGDEAEKTGKQIGDGLDKGTKSGLAGLKDNFGKAAIAGVALYEAGRQVIQFLGDSVSAASNLNEEMNKTTVVFDSSADEVQDWATTAAESFGQSERGALQAANQFGVMFSAMGKGAEESAQLSMQMVELASDMASFNNASPEEAILAIGAAMRGEMEPIRRFGVLLDDATLRQEALSQGLISSVSQALTPAQKAMAAYGAILKQTSMQQGDFARTQDSFANQQRTLAAQFEELQAAIGQALIPTLQQVIPLMSSLAQAVTAVVGPITALQEKAHELGDAFSLLPIAQMINPFERIGQVAGLTTSAIEEMNNGLGMQGPILNKIANDMGLTTAQLQQLGIVTEAAGSAMATSSLRAVEYKVGLDNVAVSANAVALAEQASNAQQTQAAALVAGLTARYQEAKAAVDNYAMSVLAASNASVAMDQATLNVENALAAEFNAAVAARDATDDKSTATNEAADASRAYRGAVLNTQTAINTYAAQAVATAAAQRGLSVEQLGGAEKAQIMKSALQQLAAANPPLQSQIQATISKLDAFDGTDAKATMTANGSQAVAEAARVSAALDAATRARTAIIHVVETSGVAGSGVGRGGGGAAGGAIVPGPYSQASPGWTLHGSEVVMNPQQQAKVLMAIAEGDMSGMGGGSDRPVSNRPIELVVNLDSKELARGVYDPLRQVTRERS